MIDSKTVNQIKQSPIADRIRFIEIILQSLKNDIKKEEANRKSKLKPFKIRKFSLGEEVHVDRDELYSDRTTSQMIRQSKIADVRSNRYFNF